MSDREKVVRQITSELLTEKFNQEVGHKAIVSRHDISSEDTNRLREVLEAIGTDMLEINAVPKGMEYIGTAAVHIYKAPVLGQVAYLNQLSLRSCPEEIAGPALSDLRGAMMEFYGHKRQKLRSGF